MGNTPLTLLTLIVVIFVTAAFALKAWWRHHIPAALAWASLVSLSAHLLLGVYARAAMIDDLLLESATGTRVMPQGVTNLPNWLYDAGLIAALALIIAAFVVKLYQLHRSRFTGLIDRFKPSAGSNPKVPTDHLTGTKYAGVHPGVNPPIMQNPSR